MDKYAVVGYPISHSKSPSIHAHFAEQTDQSMVYDKLLVEPQDFYKDLNAFFASGGKGLNITVPFKEEAYKFAGALTPRAREAEAVNTLALQSDGIILGDNTDGAGLVADLIRLGWSPYQKRILLLGAGGAVKGVLLPLINQQPLSITLANRTLQKAQALAQRYPNLINACEFSELAGQSFDLIINGTSASLTGELPPLPISLVNSHAQLYDMMYAKAPTAFLQWGLAQGTSQLADGLGMLVGQAAEAFFIWRGIKPNVEPVLQALRDQM